MIHKAQGPREMPQHKHYNAGKMSHKVVHCRRKVYLHVLTIYRTINLKPKKENQGVLLSMTQAHNA